MNTTHTPGPWAPDNQDSPVIWGGEGGQVCVARVFAYGDGEVGRLRPGVDADARLIAAAPGLLEALTGFLNSLAAMKSGDFVVARDSIWIDAARSAIDKATGEAA